MVRLAFQRNWNSRKQSETVGSGQSWSGQNCESAFFLQEKSFRAIPFFTWKFNGKQLETIGARTFDSAEKGLFQSILENEVEAFKIALATLFSATKITTFNTFSGNPSARRLFKMMQFDFETQYTLKKSKSPSPREIQY